MLSVVNQPPGDCVYYFQWVLLRTKGDCLLNERVHSRELVHCQSNPFGVPTDPNLHSVISLVTYYHVVIIITVANVLAIFSSS